MPAFSVKPGIAQAFALILMVREYPDTLEKLGALSSEAVRASVVSLMTT